MGREKYCSSCLLSAWLTQFSVSEFCGRCCYLSFRATSFDQFKIHGLSSLWFSWWDGWTQPVCSPLPAEDEQVFHLCHSQATSTFWTFCYPWSVHFQVTSSLLQSAGGCSTEHCWLVPAPVTLGSGGGQLCKPKFREISCLTLCLPSPCLIVLCSTHVLFCCLLRAGGFFLYMVGFLLLGFLFQVGSSKIFRSFCTVTLIHSSLNACRS